MMLKLDFLQTKPVQQPAPPNPEQNVTAAMKRKSTVADKVGVN